MDRRMEPGARGRTRLRASGMKTPGQCAHGRLGARKRWFLIAGASAVAGIVAVSYIRPLWRSHRPSLGTQSTALEAAVALGETKQEGPQANREEFPDTQGNRLGPAPGPSEPTPDVPEPIPVPPEGASQADQLLAALPSTVEELKREEIEVVERLMEDLPGSSDPIALMGMVHNEQGNTARAIDCWQRCLKLNPRRADVYDAMGVVAQRKQAYEEAAAHFRKALEIEPTQFGAHFHLAQVLLGTGKAEEAVAALEEGIRIHPQESESYFLLGRTYLQLREYEKAKKNYLAAIKLRPNHTNAHYGLAGTCAKLGQREESRKYLERFKELKAERLDGIIAQAKTPDETLLRPVVARTYTSAGRIYRGHGKPAKAEQLWRIAARLDPTDVASRRELAQLYEASNRNQDALRICEQLCDIDPRRAEYYANTGVLYVRVDRIHAALSALEKAMKLEPENTNYRRMYEQIQDALP